MSVLSDMSNDDLEQIYYAASRQFPSSFDGLRAVAEAAVRAEREAAVPVAWCWVSDGKPTVPIRHGKGPDEDIIKLAAARDNPVTVRYFYTAPPIPPVAPEGYALVPMKPTERMLDHAVSFALNVGPAQSGGWTEYARRMWETMVIAAASQPDADKAQGVG